LFANCFNIIKLPSVHKTYLCFVESHNNNYFSYNNRNRLDVEALRDTMLCPWTSTCRCFEGSYCLRHQGQAAHCLTLMMKAVLSLKTSRIFHSTTQRKIASDLHLQQQSFKNLSSVLKRLVFVVKTL